MTLDDTFSSRESINAELLAKVQRDSERWGVAITRVEVFNISPPSDILDAMANQVSSVAYSGVVGLISFYAVADHG